MKDVVELQLSPNPSHRIGSKIKETIFSGEVSDFILIKNFVLNRNRVDKSGKKHGAEYHCPISTLEMNGRHKFGFILQTGTVG